MQRDVKFPPLKTWICSLAKQAWVAEGSRSSRRVDVVKVKKELMGSVVVTLGYDGFDGVDGGFDGVDGCSDGFVGLDGTNDVDGSGFGGLGGLKDLGVRSK